MNIPNPVLCCGALTGSTSEVWTDGVVKAKVLFMGTCTCFAVELASSTFGANCTVNVPYLVRCLPSTYCASLTSNVPYVDKFICATLGYPHTKQIMSFQFCACVVSMNETIGWKVASGSEMG